MPISYYGVSQYLARSLLLCEPKPGTILDIGVGFGMNGVMVRTYLDGQRNNNFIPKDWTTHLIGVEAFKKYYNPIYGLYNLMIDADILDLMAEDSIPPSDFVILGDVIEHLSKDEGKKLIENLKGRTRHIFISTPAIFYEQCNEFENTHEKHLCLWTKEELKELGFEILWGGEPDIWGNRMLIAQWDKV